MKETASATILKPSEIEECYSKKNFKDYFKTLNAFPSEEPADSAIVMGAADSVFAAEAGYKGEW